MRNGSPYGKCGPSISATIADRFRNVKRRKAPVLAGRGTDTNSFTPSFYPFVAPDVSPSTNRDCRSRKSTITGNNATMRAAISKPHSTRRP